MRTLLILAVITVLLLLYALWGREWLKSKPWSEGFFALIEPVEIFCFKKSETIIVARTLQMLGAVLTALTWLGSIDITPLMPLVPDKHEAIVKAAFSFLPLILNALGAIVEHLRNRTTKPIELVSIPDKVVSENGAVAVAIANAEAAKTEAVSEVKIAVSFPDIPKDA